MSCGTCSEKTKRGASAVIGAPAATGAALPSVQQHCPTCGGFLTRDGKCLNPRCEDNWKREAIAADIAGMAQTAREFGMSVKVVGADAEMQTAFRRHFIEDHVARLDAILLDGYRARGWSDREDWIKYNDGHHFQAVRNYLPGLLSEDPDEVVDAMQGVQRNIGMMLNLTQEDRAMFVQVRAVAGKLAQKAAGKRAAPSGDLQQAAQAMEGMALPRL